MLAVRILFSQAMEQFNTIEQSAAKTGYYKGESLAWGEGGTSSLLRDKLAVKGYNVDDIDTLVKRQYVKERYWRLENNLPI